MTGKTHYLDSMKVHYKWDNSFPSALVIDPGDIVKFNLQESSGGQINSNSTVKDLNNLDLDRICPLSGPIYVQNISSNDVLEVEILDYNISNWGWSAIHPGFDLLAGDFDSYLHHWDISNKISANLNSKLVVPLNPSVSIMGVAPKESGSFHPLSPNNSGGNMSISDISKGVKLLLPVNVDGALFSCGSGKAALGDGKICSSGIETNMSLTLKFHVHKELELEEPQFIINKHSVNEKKINYYVTTGISPDLLNATKKAVKYMIRYLTSNYNLTSQEAYILCSIALKLKINQVVNKPNWVVSAYIPLNLLS